MRRSGWLVLACALAVVAAACGREGETTEPGPSDSGVTATSEPDGSGDGESALDSGAFGDLGVVCQPAAQSATAKAAVDPGVTADSIQISTFSDAGFAGRPGLNQELIDTAEAFTKWCNEHGGINGRTIDLIERDARLNEFQQRVIEACDDGDFFTVGGGATFDDTGQRDRLACGLPTIVAFAVSAEAAAADLSIQPVPNPPNQISVGSHRWLAQQLPDSTQSVGIFAASIAATESIAARHKEAIVDGLGWKVVYDATYNPLGEAAWRPFLEAMRGAGVRGLIWVGEPSYLAKLLTEAESLDITFDWVTADANHYDPVLTDSAGSAADNTFIRSTFFPFLTDEDASANPATEQYRTLMREYDPNGKIAYLGVQSLSAWLLFAKAASECGVNLTRDCVWSNASGIEEWSGGGLHAPSDLTGGAGGNASTCWSLVGANNGDFGLADIDPTDGPYVCAADSVYDLQGNYGQGAKCASKEYAADPKPSTCV